MNEQDIACAGRVIVVGTQGGGKTAMATKLASMNDPKAIYQEEFGGTVETEYLKVTASNQSLYTMLLPVGGQEKWASLRTAYGETAEGIIAVLDSCTKEFWSSSLRQAAGLAPRIPYDNYPIGFVFSKSDLNETLKDHSRQVAFTIVKGMEAAKENGLTYYSRGHKVIQRKIPPIRLSEVPFSIAEQIIVNSLEQEFFSNLEPGNARKGTQKMKGFSLVNCRLFSRALTAAISVKTSSDQTAFLSLLNDMRPTLLELDGSWATLQRKYPGAGTEPLIPLDLDPLDLEIVIYEKLLANREDISNIVLKAADMADETGWKVEGHAYASIFDDSIHKMASLVEDMMKAIKHIQPAEKFTLLDPVETLF